MYIIHFVCHVWYIREPTRIYSGHVSAGLGAESEMPTTT